MSPLEHHPLVVFGDDWGRHVSSMQHLFRHVITRREVIWVNSIGHRVPTLSTHDFRRVIEKYTRPALPVDTDSSGLGGQRPGIVVEPKVVPWHHWPLVHAINNWSLTRSIREALHHLNGGKPPIVITGSPPSVGVLGRLGEIGSIYFCMDDFLHLPGVSVEMVGPLERRLLGKVDAVVATAAALVERKRCPSGRGYHLAQGVNYEHFARPRSMPVELAALPRPIVGFAGGISGACDLETLRTVAEAIPGGSLVLVGPVTVALDALNLPNVRVLGPRPYEQLPAYIQAFDVALIPYVDNPWTQAVDPLKLLEYLSAGAAVVATPLPEVLKYRQVIRTAPLGQPFAAAVENALRTPGRFKAEGREVARANTWQRRASRFLEILDEVFGAASPDAFRQ